MFALKHVFMKRRDYLKATGVAGMGALAGCANLGGGGVSGVFVEQGTTIQEEQRGLELQVDDIFSERSAFVNTPLSEGGLRLEYPPFERFVYVDLNFFDGQPERYNLVFVVDDTLIEPVGFSEDFSSLEPIEYEAQGEVLVYRIPQPLVEDANTVGFSWRRLEEQAAIWEVDSTLITDHPEPSLTGELTTNYESGDSTGTIEGTLNVDGVEGTVRILVSNSDRGLTRPTTYSVSSDQTTIDIREGFEYIEGTSIVVDWGRDYTTIEL